MKFCNKLTQRVKEEEEGWLKWTVKPFQTIETNLNTTAPISKNTTLNNNLSKNNFNNWIIMNHRMRFQELQEEIFIWEEATVNMNQDHDTIFVTEQVKGIIIMRMNKKRKRKKEHSREEVQRKMFKRCLKMILSESMILVGLEREEKRTEWQFRMMNSFKISKKSLNLVVVLTHIQEEEIKQEIMDLGEDEVDQNEWLFHKWRKTHLKGHKINTLV